MSAKTENRNRTVLEAALAVSKERGWQNLTRDGVAVRAGVGAGSVNNAYGTMDALRDAVMAHAVAEATRVLVDGEANCADTHADMVAIVAAGLAVGHTAARNAPEAVRAEAVAHLTDAA